MINKLNILKKKRTKLSKKSFKLSQQFIQIQDKLKILTLKIEELEKEVR